MKKRFAFIGAMMLSCITGSYAAALPASLIVNESKATITVKGTVVDSNGEPIAGATIIIPGTTRGTVTDADGHFTIAATAGQTLQASFLGYKTTTTKAGDGSIAHLLAKKDKRLSVLVDSIVSYKGHGWTRVDPNGAVTLPAQMTSSTGYTILKYDNASMPTVYRTSTVGNYTDAPLYWYAVVLLNEAEAKAELGTITQTDLDKTVNLLQARAGLPAMTVNPEADPANNHGVSNLLWEIRRCRRCELMTDNWYRYWDLVRWHQLDKLDSQKYPDINHGANLSAVDHTGSTVDANGYRLATEATRTFNAKYYHYPVPTNEITLNPSIKQNPGW